MNRELTRSRARKRAIRNRRLKGTLAAVGATTVVIAPGAVAADSTGHHNIAGAGGHQNPGWDWKVAPIYYRALSNGLPSVLSLNESCQNQTAKLWQEMVLASNGTWFVGDYQAISGANSASSNCPTNNWFGNSALVRAQGFNPTINTGIYAGETGVERKGWVCITGGINQPKYYACSTHFWPAAFDPQGQPGVQFKWAQFNNVLDIHKLAYGKVNAGADVYTTWSDISAWTPSFWSGYREVGRCVSPYSQSATLWPWNRRVDHIFFGSAQSCTSNGGTYQMNWSSGCNSSLSAYESWFCNRSDHRVVYGNNSTI